MFQNVISSVPTVINVAPSANCFGKFFPTKSESMNLNCIGIKKIENAESEIHSMTA